MTGDVPSELASLLAARDDVARNVAWDAFVARYSRLLLVIAREYGGVHDDVMDRYAVILERLRDDDFRRLRVWTNDRRSALTTWLGVVARRTCLDELRRRYGRARGSSVEALETRRQRRRLTDLVTEELIPEMDAADAHGTVAEAELAVRRGSRNVWRSCQATTNCCSRCASATNARPPTSRESFTSRRRFTCIGDSRG